MKELRSRDEILPNAEYDKIMDAALFRSFAEAMRQPEVIEAVTKGIHSATYAKPGANFPTEAKEQAEAAITAALAAMGATEGEGT